ncbi:hypothetical protein Psch_01826 [Pelotomaculum schinkii]|uniref:Uncharacterized protein n=1 Tax=Pelotomaculum schinkii TaxID=78350 RepID=A0A4Y7RHJ7_9FIRM|nr:hypothetical protein Psch_01826 [Pelotomaculum schinkii]
MSKDLRGMPESLTTQDPIHSHNDPKEIQWDPKGMQHIPTSHDPLHTTQRRFDGGKKVNDC